MVSDRDLKPENVANMPEPTTIPLERARPLNDWAAPRRVTREARRTVEQLRRRRFGR